jgi:hypothetical protein
MTDLKDNHLYIRTFGTFSITSQGKPLDIEWPNGSSRLLFCSLLNPYDELLSWDRLNREPRESSSLGAGNSRVIAKLNQLAELFSLATGIYPFRSNCQGASLDYSKVELDAWLFREHVCTGLNHLAEGKQDNSLTHFIIATSLYKGQFLPGVSGRIVNFVRTELDELYRMSLKCCGISQSDAQTKSSLDLTQVDAPIVEHEINTTNTSKNIKGVGSVGLAPHCIHPHAVVSS